VKFDEREDQENGGVGRLHKSKAPRGVRNHTSCCSVVRNHSRTAPPFTAARLLEHSLSLHPPPSTHSYRQPATLSLAQGRSRVIQHSLALICTLSLCVSQLAEDVASTTLRLLLFGWNWILESVVDIHGAGSSPQYRLRAVVAQFDTQSFDSRCVRSDPFPGRSLGRGEEKFWFNICSGQIRPSCKASVLRRQSQWNGLTSLIRTFRKQKQWPPILHGTVTGSGTAALHVVVLKISNHDRQYSLAQPRLVQVLAHDAVATILTRTNIQHHQATAALQQMTRRR